MKIINQFSIRSRKWSGSQFFVRKFDNYNGCDIYFLRFSSSEQIATDIPPDGSGDLTGFTYRIVGLISSALNLTGKITTKTNTKVKNLTDHGIILMERLHFDPFMLSFFDLPTTYTHHQSFFAITKGRLYTPWEMMLIPFDVTSWWLIMATFVSATLTIAVTRLFPASIRKFAFVHNNRSPVFNLFVVFFGAGMTKLPRLNFARFALMLFIVWSLIIRSCYQGMLLKIFQDELRLPNAQTLAQISAENFQLYIPGFVEDSRYYDDQKFIQK